jgi:uncharacterized membrane protein required for colicin V production
MAVEISWADFTIIVLMVFLGLEGYRTGFFNGLLSVGGFFFSLLITLFLLPQAARFFNYVVELPSNMSILMGFATVYVISMLLYELFLKWLHKIMEMKVEARFNRIFGTVLGLYKGILIVSLLALGFSLLPLPDMVRSAEERSLFLRPVKYFTPVNYNFFRRLFPGSPSFEATLKNTADALGGLDETATDLIQAFGSQQLEKSVTTKRR